MQPSGRERAPCARREGDREVVYKEIKHLTMLRDVRQVVTIYEVFENGSDYHIVMEVHSCSQLAVSS